MADKKIHLAALAEYGTVKLHFVDCEIAAHARASACAVASFDQGLRKLPGIDVAVD